MSRVYPLLVAGLIVMALTAAACGSSSSSGSTTTTAPTSPTTLSTAPATTSGGGAGDTGFCGSAKKDLKDLQAEDSSLLAGGVTPDATKTGFSNLRSPNGKAPSQAPAGIKPALPGISRLTGSLKTGL